METAAEIIGGLIGMFVLGIFVGLPGLIIYKLIKRAKRPPKPKKTNREIRMEMLDKNLKDQVTSEWWEKKRREEIEADLEREYQKKEKI